MAQTGANTKSAFSHPFLCSETLRRAKQGPASVIDYSNGSRKMCERERERVRANNSNFPVRIIIIVIVVTTSHLTGSAARKLRTNSSEAFAGFELRSSLFPACNRLSTHGWKAAFYKKLYALLLNKKYDAN